MILVAISVNNEDMENTTNTTTAHTASAMKTQTGSKIHLGWAGSRQAVCGARVVMRAGSTAKITCERCASTSWATKALDEVGVAEAAVAVEAPAVEPASKMPSVAEAMTEAVRLSKMMSSTETTVARVSKNDERILVIVYTAAYDEFTTFTFLPSGAVEITMTSAEDIASIRATAKVA